MFNNIYISFFFFNSKFNCMALDDKHWNVRNLILWDKSKPEEGHCQSVVPGYLKKKKKLSTPPVCSLYLFRPLWCVASRTEKTTRRITIPLFSDGNNYIFCSKQPKMHTSTYFPVSPEPQITPESYLASSRLDAVMIYSGGTFSCQSRVQPLSRCRAGSHPEVKTWTLGWHHPGSDVRTHLVFSQSAGLSLATLFTQTTLHRVNTNIRCLAWCL